MSSAEAQLTSLSALKSERPRSTPQVTIGIVDTERPAGGDEGRERGAIIGGAITDAESVEGSNLSRSITSGDGTGGGGGANANAVESRSIHATTSDPVRFTQMEEGLRGITGGIQLDFHDERSNTIT
jgi:hypothetical protein